MAADRMGVVEHNLAVRRFQAVELGGQRVVVGAVIEAQPLRDLSLVGLVEAIERFALEGRRRAQLGRRLSGIEDRKSVVEGRSVSVSVDLGGRRTIKKKKYK